MNITTQEYSIYYICLEINANYYKSCNVIQVVVRYRFCTKIVIRNTEIIW